jgi:hypothetical protein
LAGLGDRFASDLFSAFTRYGWSQGQRAWAHKLALEGDQRLARRLRELPRENAGSPAPVATESLGELFGIEMETETLPALAESTLPEDPPAKRYPKILALLQRAHEKLKYPKVRLELEDGRKVKLQLAGSQSRTPGTVNVTDGKPFGENVWYGRIALDGAWEPSRSGCPAEVEVLLDRLEVDPAGLAKVHGQRFGNCCFCGLELTTKESVCAGYGPICADKWGLPWGDTSGYDLDHAAEYAGEVEAEKRLGIR